MATGRSRSIAPISSSGSKRCRKTSPPPLDPEQEHHGETEDVKERRERHSRGAGWKLILVLDQQACGAIERGQQVGVREHRSLRHACRAAGVLQRSDVVQRVDADGERLGIRPRDQVAVGDIAGAQRSRCAAGHHDRPDGRRLDDAEQRPVRARVDDGDLGARVAQQPLELRGGVRRIDLHDDRAEMDRGKEADDVRSAVGHHQRYPVAPLHAESRQAAREAVAQLLELAVGDLLATIAQCDCEPCLAAAASRWSESEGVLAVVLGGLILRLLLPLGFGLSTALPVRGIRPCA